MHDDAISEEQRAALLALAPTAREGFYLAGGTGLCLWLAHRRSLDIDLFREAEFDPEETARWLGAEGVPMANVRTKPSTLWFEVAGVPVSLMSFPYPNAEAPKRTGLVPVASLADIAAMKIEAIAARGARKDFVDLYFICSEGLGLGGAFDAFERRFAGARPDIVHRLKALTYFEDAEREPELLLLRPAAWSEVRAFFEREVEAQWVRRAP